MGFHKLDSFSHNRCLGADRALCCFHIDVYNLALCRCETEFPSYELLTNYFQHGTAVSTMLLPVRKRYDFIPGRDTFKDI